MAPSSSQQSPSHQRSPWPQRLLGIIGPWPKAQSRTDQHVDAGIGFLIFWALVLVVVVVVCQVNATPAAASTCETAGSSP